MSYSLARITAHERLMLALAFATFIVYLLTFIFTFCTY